jgi:hypothetical protein
MKKYEYKCVFIGGLGEKTTRVLTQYGQQGWELSNRAICLISFYLF